MTSVTIAVVASLETLLSIDATDKIDPLRRTTPTSRELKAQGLGNIVAGLFGGLPITAVPWPRWRSCKPSGASAGRRLCTP